MKMAWWIVILLLMCQIILLQYLIESYLEARYHLLPYYAGALGVGFLVIWGTCSFFRRIDDTRE